MNLTEAIIGRAKSGVDVDVFAGSPRIDDYPVVIVDLFPEQPTNQTLGESYHAERMFQVSVAALDPIEAETIGVAIEANLKPSAGPIAWDSGRPGREITRWPGDTREREQAEAGPDGRTIYYYEIDTIMLIQRGAG